MVYSHCLGLLTGMGPGMGWGSMGSHILRKNGYAGLRQGQGPDSTSPVPCTISGPVFMQCKYAITLPWIWFYHFYCFVSVNSINGMFLCAKLSYKNLC